jgi:hypothetical protein
MDVLLSKSLGLPKETASQQTKKVACSHDGNQFPDRFSIPEFDNDQPILDERQCQVRTAP